MRQLKTPALRPILGYLLLGIAFVMAVPAFAGPDEEDHYRRVESVASGHLIGKRVPLPTPGLNPAQTELLSDQIREARMPAGRSPVGYNCFKASAVLAADCQDNVVVNQATEVQGSIVGVYPPLPYLLPAVVADAGSSAPQALRVERLASFAVVFALLAGALLCAAGTPWLLLGVMLSLPPAVLLIGTSLGGSGLEISAAIACATGLLSLGLGRRPGVALAVAVAGALALVSARAIGPLWLLATLAACVPLCLTQLRAVDRRVLFGIGAALIVAIVLQRLWEGAYEPDTPIDLIPNLESLKAEARQLPDRLRESIGGVGYLEYLLPWPLVIAWAAAVAAVMVQAAKASRTVAERAVLAGLAIGAVVVAPLLFAALVVFTGFGVQGRYVLPFLVLVPIVSGAIAARHRVSAAPVRWIGWGIGAVQFIAFVLVAHRYAVGTDGPAWFLGEGWAPPLGWLPWLILAAAGAALVATSLSARGQQPESDGRSVPGQRRSQATAPS